MVGIVLVSHSAALAGGLAEIVGQVAGEAVHVETAGGSSDGRLGTSGEKVEAALENADTGDGVVVLFDLGSSVLVVRHLLESARIQRTLPAGRRTAGRGRGGGGGGGLQRAVVGEVAAAAEGARDARKF